MGSYKQITKSISKTGTQSEFEYKKRKPTQTDILLMRHLTNRMLQHY